jgi:hypothetical protein
MKVTLVLFINRCPITLLTRCDNPQSIFRHRPLHSNRFLIRKPCVPFLGCREQYRSGAQCRSILSSKTPIVDVRRSRPCARRSIAAKFQQSEERPAFIKCEPMSHLRPAVCPFAKRRCRKEAAPLGLEPSAPIGRFRIADIGDWRIAEIGGGGKAQCIRMSSRSPSRAVRTTGAIVSG